MQHDPPGRTTASQQSNPTAVRAPMDYREEQLIGPSPFESFIQQRIAAEQQRMMR